MITHTTTAATVLLAAFAVALSGCGGSARSTGGTAPATTDIPTTVIASTSTTAPTTAPAPSTPAPTTTAPPRPTGTRDEFVAVDGMRIHARCAGSGATTVLLIPGFEASSDAWDAVIPAIAERTRVCTYDRLGTGTSDRPATTQTFATQAAQLHSLLEVMGEPGPYVVVGHSFGGAEAVAFSATSTDNVDALVLVDASPPGWPDALCAVDDGTDAAVFIQGMCEQWGDPTNNVEQLDVFGAFELMAHPASLGSLPVTVITAVDRELLPGISDAERTRLTRTWDEGQQRWTQLSSTSLLVSVPDAGHNVQIERPELVADEIARLLP